MTCNGGHGLPQHAIYGQLVAAVAATAGVDPGLLRLLWHTLQLSPTRPPPAHPEQKEACTRAASEGEVGLECGVSEKQTFNIGLLVRKNH